MENIGNMKFEQAVIVKILPTKIWIESGVCGEKAVMVQHEGCEPFEYAIFNYDHRYTSNSGTWDAATMLACELGAKEPIERRSRSFLLHTAEGIRQQIADLEEELALLEKSS